MTFCRSLLPGDLLLRVHASGLYDGSTVWWKFYCGWTNWHKALSQWVCGLWAIICPEEKQTEWTWRNHRRWTTMDICEQIFFTEVWKWSMWVGINRAKKCEYKFYAMQKKKSCFRSDQRYSPLMLFVGLPTSAHLVLWLEAYVSISPRFPRTKSLLSQWWDDWHKVLFFPSKPLYAHPEDLMYRLWWWELCSLGLAYLLLTLVLQVSRVSFIHIAPIHNKSRFRTLDV